MSQPSSSRQPGEGLVQKQKPNVYTVMLILSFVALFMACLLLYLELARYGPIPSWKTEGAKPAPVSQVSPPWSAPQGGPWA